MNRALQSLRALLLATIFVAGNLVLPEVDIFLDHGLNAPRSAQVVHLERPGGCRDHAEHCILSRLLGNLGGQPAASTVAVTRATLTSASLGSAGLRLATLRSPTPYLGRAPPTPLL